MELSILLTQQIISMFLMMGAGFLLIKLGILKGPDTKIVSAIVVYLCVPCLNIKAFRMEYSNEKLVGLLIAIGAAALINALMIFATRMLKTPFKLNNVERASITYSNCGNMIIPLVAAVLGEQWMFYCCAYVVVQTFLLWTHGLSMLTGTNQMNLKKILLNVNVISVFIGLFLFLTGLQLPTIVMNAVGGIGDMLGPMSMIGIGMLLGTVDFKVILRQKRLYLIAAMRLIVYPSVAVVLFATLARIIPHPDASSIFLIVLLAAVAPTAAMVTQLSELYGKDAKYASVINVTTTIFSILTMPVAIFFYEMLIS